MTTIYHKHEPRFQALLKKQKLDDLSQFHQPNFFEEVPLYSRESDISFLGNASIEEKNLLLLDFCLDFMKSVIAYQRHLSPFLVAVTVWNYSETEPIVPNLFVWSATFRELRKKLILRIPRKAFTRKIRKDLSKIRGPGEYLVAEDSVTLSDITRAFIGPAIAPYRGFVCLSALERSNLV